MAAFAVRLIRTVSIGVCLVAILSFLLFALNQTSTASGHQQEELSGKPAAAQTHESSFRKTIDEISEQTTSPVAGLSSSQWGERGLRLIFALLVFGFALGYLARVLRVRS